MAELVFTWENFMTGKIAVHCPTDFDARNFLEQCLDHNLNELSFKPMKSPVLDTKWCWNKEDTCYYYSAAQRQILVFNVYTFIRSIKIVDSPMVFPQVHIQTDGTKTFAVMSLGAKTLRKVNLECEPWNFHYDAEVEKALCKLINSDS